MINNKNIKKAEEELEYLTGDEEIRRLAYLREKAIRDEMAAMAHARKEGVAEGIAKGIAQGKIEGITEEKKALAKKMLEKQFKLDIITEITGLTEEEIEKL